VSIIYSKLVAYNNITLIITTLQHANKEYNKIKIYHLYVTPWDPSLLFSASQLLWEWGDIVPGLYPILA
jgi:hypothetical protein